MSKCPKCNSHISNWKVLSLNPDNKLVKCEQCRTTLTSNTDRLFYKTQLFVYIGAALIILSKSISKDYYLNHITFSIGAILCTIGIVIFFKTIEFEVSEIELLDEETNSKSEEIEKFKLQYRNHTILELEKISIENGWRTEAKEAANELLKEKIT